MPFGDRSVVAIDVAGKVVTAHDSNGAMVAVDPALAASIAKAASLRYLLHGQGKQEAMAIVVIGTPSTNTGGRGYCGAGQEDDAVLVEKKHNVIALKDRYLLQSCLRSITLDAPDPDDIRTALVLDAAHFSFAFTLLGDANKAQTVVRVDGGKFAAQVPETTLCEAGEQVFFSCTSGQKIISICAAPKNVVEDYIAYRFAAPDRPAFAWRADKKNPLRRFNRATLSGASTASTVLWFENAGYSYVVSDPVKGMPSLVVKKAGKEIGRSECTGNMTIDLATRHPYVTEKNSAAYFNLFD